MTNVDIGGHDTWPINFRLVLFGLPFPVYVYRIVVIPLLFLLHRVRAPLPFFPHEQYLYKYVYYVFKWNQTHPLRTIDSGAQFKSGQARNFLMIFFKLNCSGYGYLQLLKKKWVDSLAT